MTLLKEFDALNSLDRERKDVIMGNNVLHTNRKMSVADDTLAGQDQIPTVSDFDLDIRISVPPTPQLATNNNTFRPGSVEQERIAITTSVAASCYLSCIC